MLIDAHQHFWRVGRDGFQWPTPDLAAIYRDYGPDDLRAAAAGLDLAGCVTVQSQPCDADTDRLLALAAAEPLVLGVVGWVDLLAPNAGDRLAALARQSKFKGVRPMLQNLPDPAWIIQPALEPALDALERLDLSLDALVYPRHLPHLLTLASRRPGLRIVIDHGAKPPIAAGKLGAWAEAMSLLAARPGVVCKLSGLLAEASPGAPPEATTPYIDCLFELFGPNRLMWGSDWPVLNLTGQYRTWYDQVRSHPALREAATARAVMGEVARAFYRLEGGAA